MSNEYSRWSVAIKTDYTCGDYDEGVSYVADVVRGLTLVQSSDLFIKQFSDSINKLQNKAGFLTADKTIMSKA